MRREPHACEGIHIGQFTYTIYLPCQLRDASDSSLVSLRQVHFGVFVRHMIISCCMFSNDCYRSFRTDFCPITHIGTARLSLPRFLFTQRSRIQCSCISCGKPCRSMIRIQRCSVACVDVPARHALLQTTYSIIELSSQLLSRSQDLLPPLYGPWQWGLLIVAWSSEDYYRLFWQRLRSVYGKSLMTRSMRGPRQEGLHQVFDSPIGWQMICCPN